MKKFINKQITDLKQDYHNPKTKGELVGGIFALIILILTFLGAFSTAKATYPQFNLEPPENVKKWQINVLKGGYNAYQYKWTNYAWYKYHDKEFMYMLASENGLYNHDRRSLVPGEPSYGFCQIHQDYHPQIVNNPKFFTDPAWQMDRCYDLWTSGTKFYGYERFKTDTKFREDRIKLFNI